jgi:hypothetical protein
MGIPELARSVIGNGPKLDAIGRDQTLEAATASSDLLIEKSSKTAPSTNAGQSLPLTMLV